MSLFDFFRNFFLGSSGSSSVPSDSGFRNDFRNPIWDSNEGDDSDNDFRSAGGSFSFNIYSNPLEIHRYFEQQMNEIIKNFFVTDPFQDGDSFFNSGFPQFPGIEDHSPFNFLPQPPDIGESKSPDVDSPKDLREQLLKPEFRKVEKPSDKVDTSLDGKVNTDDIVRAFDSKDSVVPIWTPNDREKAVVPFKDTFNFSSGRSVVSRIVRRPDGSTEREEIVKNSDGSETKTVTRILGNHEYSMTIHKDASGAERSTENYKNIDPEKLEDFNKAWDAHNSKWWSW